MSYVNQTQAKKPGAAIATVAIHAVIGVGLVTGLSGYVGEVFVDKPLPANKFPIEKIPPPPPPTVEPETTLPPIESTPYVPPVRIPIATNPPEVTPGLRPSFADEVPLTPSAGPGVLPLTPPALPPAPPAKLYDPVAAAPANDATRWVRLSDYRSRWRREEMTGSVGYRLGISPNGKVDSCTVTRSAGHATLDQATCQLVTKRARFEAARDGDNRAVSGSYNGTVVWQIPE